MQPRRGADGKRHLLGGFLSLKVSVYAAGGGTVRLRDFRFRALTAA